MYKSNTIKTLYFKIWNKVMKTAEDKLEEISKWIVKTKQSIIDPDDEGITEEEMIDEGFLDEADQAQLQILNELEMML